MEGHGPVVGDGVDDVRHARVDGSLRVPHVRAHEGDVPVEVAKDRDAELRVLLVARVVRELPEPLGVEGLPVERVEGRNALGETRSQGVEVVLVSDDLRAGGLGEGREVEPVGGVSHGMRRGGHGHRDAVVAEPHADVAHDDRRAVGAGDRPVRDGGLRRERRIRVDVKGVAPLGDDEVVHPEGVADHGHVRAREVVHGRAVVPVLLEVARLLLACLGVGRLVLLVSEDRAGPV